MNLKVTEKELEEWDHCPLLQFLEEQRDIGEFESSSSFSVDLDAAQRKLGKFTLPRPTAWILKFVQVANEIGCEDITIHMKKDELQITLGQAGDFELKKIAESLAGLAPKNSVETHLFIGLIALRNYEGTVLVSDSRGSWDLKSDSPIKESDVPECFGLRITHRPEPLNFFARLRGRVAQTIGVLEELQTWCYASAVPIFVDGAPLQPCQPTIPLVNGLLTDDPNTRILVGSDIDMGDYDRKGTFSSWASNKSLKISYAVRIEHRPIVPEPSICLDWIRSGVIIKREAKNVQTCQSLLVRTLVPAKDLRFDLTGFGFEETEISRYRRRRGAFYTWHGLRALNTKMALRRRWDNYLKEHFENPAFPPRSQDELLQEIGQLMGELKNPRL